MGCSVVIIYNMYIITTIKVGNFRMDFNPYKLHTQTNTQKYSYLNMENFKKTNSIEVLTSLQHLTSINFV